MKKALWIIATVEVIRALQNMVQLQMLAGERRRARELQDKAFDKYAEAMERDNEIRIVMDDDCQWK